MILAWDYLSRTLDNTSHLIMVGLDFNHALQFFSIWKPFWCYGVWVLQPYDTHIRDACSPRNSGKPSAKYRFPHLHMVLCNSRRSTIKLCRGRGIWPHFDKPAGNAHAQESSTQDDDNPMSFGQRTDQPWSVWGVRSDVCKRTRTGETTYPWIISRSNCIHLHWPVIVLMFFVMLVLPRRFWFKVRTWN